MKLFFVIGILLACTQASAIDCQHRTLSPSKNKDGYISSPNYPEPYPRNFCQMWFVYGHDPHLHVTIRIIDMNIPSLGDDRHCHGDSLTFGPISKQEFCGRIHNEVYESNQHNFFYIIFNTSGSSLKGKGFVLHYSFASDYPLYTEAPPPKVTEMSHKRSSRIPAASTLPTSFASCSSIIEMSSGRITLSPSQLRLGNIYNGNTEVWTCSWLLLTNNISVNMESFYHLKFGFIRLYPKSFLDIYEGKDNQGPLKRSISHETSYALPDLSIKSEAVFIKMTVPLEFLNQGYSGNFSVSFERTEKCKSSYRNCRFNEKACYRYENQCNGVWDCPLYGGDERGCSYECSSDKFSCRDKLRYCYSYAERCDGRGTCINYSDEENCTPEMCSPSKGLYLCKNKHCIFEKMRCDGTRDCSDGSDERDCHSTLLSPRIIMATIVGSLLCSLLLIITLNFACRIYAIRNHRHRGETGHETPLSRLEAELLRHRAPPPSYSEAMSTSRPYDEAYREVVDDIAEQNSADGTVPSQQDSSQHSTHPASLRLEANESTGNRRQRRRGHQRRQAPNAPQTAAPPSGLLSAASQRCQLLLYRAGLAPPPYSLVDSTSLPENSNDESAENDLVTEAPSEPYEARDETPSPEVSSLSSSDFSPLNQYQELSAPLPESYLSPTDQMSIQTAEALEVTGNFNLDQEDSDKETDDSSQSSVCNAEVGETSLSTTNAAEDEIHRAYDKPDGEDDDNIVCGNDRQNDDSDDCECILSEENDLNDESRINPEDMDSLCILNE